MAKYFLNLSIYRKILLGFSVIGGFSAVLVIIGIFQLYSIEKITISLKPHVDASEYLQEAMLSLELLDSDIERYTTVGGVENKDNIENDISRIGKFSLQIEAGENVARGKELSNIRQTIFTLRDDIGDLINFEEVGEMNGRNERIVRVYVSLGELRSQYSSLRKDIENEFKQSLDAQSRSVASAINQFVIIELLIVILGIVIAIALSRMLTAPITKLALVAAEFGKGKLDARVDIHTKDEIETLANTFNSMAEHLARYTTNLEGEVEKRTEELKQKVKEINSSNQLLTKREEELTLVNERLRELDKAKSEFISVAAHQLRTPLSAIKWILSLLIDEDAKNLTPEQRSLIMKGYESNERIINLINEMLVVTRIESGKIQYNFISMHIEDLIDSVLIDFAGQAHVRRIKLVFEKPSSPLPYVKADPEKMRSVIQNLIENAIHYTKDGGKITISVLVENNFVRVLVKDDGIGIPVHQHSSIFIKFFRADNAVKYQTDGSGLGLFVAKSIIEKQGGQIGFESALDKGSTFYFTIPLSENIPISPV
ncbi:MAG: hypothetical protein A2648_00590 [Candidatus Lloydbacteria bacterium RIFCSPHIGHO2_01_FULL_41_20]|uniref:histidine kinase n=1 Tax=Candidatus Lloydbacteria bacterium RIFCSPHIGHO2_01_FULL_41_20 TaxID=1798657 RepID=A0A1G2CR95_9BACT|nr:MAG: hypothetical protein A2648_00590 [Candidatus Lloydbacteria bacterium RIFCSPHIGHO2_01_FULL_41_20]